jgi:hypothetical protein
VAGKGRPKESDVRRYLRYGVIGGTGLGTRITSRQFRHSSNGFLTARGWQPAWPLWDSVVTHFCSAQDIGKHSRKVAIFFACVVGVPFAGRVRDTAQLRTAISLRADANARRSEMIKDFAFQWPGLRCANGPWMHGSITADPDEHCSLPDFWKALPPRCSESSLVRVRQAARSGWGLPDRFVTKPLCMN